MLGEAARAFGPHAVARDDELRPIPASQLLRDPPRRDWMIEGCFLRGTVSMVSGDGGIGKSLLMQQMCTCVTLGRPFLDMAVTRGRALFLGCEDDGDELHRRQVAINRHLAAPMEDVIEAGLELVPRVGQDNGLMMLDRKTWRMQRCALMDRLVTLCRRLGVQYVVIDTATKTFRGNQNDETQVDDYITELRRFAVAIQGVVVFTKHPSMSGRALGTGESGNVAWGNSVRSRFYLRKDKSGGVVFEGLKQNYGPLGSKIPVRWEQGVWVREQPALRDYSEPEGYR
jgi:RecA-family ATPase